MEYNNGHEKIYTVIFHGKNKMKSYIIKKKLMKVVLFLLIDGTIFFVWRLFTSYSGFLSESSKKLSMTIMCLLMLVPVWKLKIWTVITEKVLEGKITNIQKSTSTNISYTGVHPNSRLPIGLDSSNVTGYVYSYFIVFVDKQGKKHDITLEYVDNAHIFPYKVGDEIIIYPYASFPQIKEEEKTVCIFCGMPIIKQDLDDRKCHYCGKDIMKNI